MEIQNNGYINNSPIVKNDVNTKETPTNSFTPQTSNELVSSNASMAARSYAMNNINFEGKWTKILEELQSQKPSDKIKLTFNDAQNILQRLGFTVRQNGGSHVKFVKDGIRTITIPKPHEGLNTIKAPYVSHIRDYIRENNVTTLKNA